MEPKAQLRAGAVASRKTSRPRGAQDELGISGGLVLEGSDGRYVPQPVSTVFFVALVFFGRSLLNEFSVLTNYRHL